MDTNKVYKALGIGLVSLPLLLGMGCEKKEPKTFEATVMAEGRDYRDKNYYYIFLERDDGGAVVFSYYGKKAEEIDRQYDVGDRITLTEHSFWYRFKWAFQVMFSK